MSNWMGVEGMNIKKKDKVINENAFYYDQQKMNQLVNKYSSFEEMMEKEFNMKEGSHYTVRKEPGKMSIWGGALKSKKVRASAFLNAVDATFVKPGTLVRDLQSDADGTTYSPKFVSGTTAGSGGAPIRKGSSPSKKARSGSSISSKEKKKEETVLPSTEEFTSGGPLARVVVKFTEEVSKGLYKAEISRGRVSLEQNIRDRDFLASGLNKRKELVRNLILPNSKALFGIDFPEYVMVRNFRLEATLDPVAYEKNERDLEFIVRSMSNDLKVDTFRIKTPFSTDMAGELVNKIELALIGAGVIADTNDTTAISRNKADVIRRGRDPKIYRLNKAIAELLLKRFSINADKEWRDSGVEFDAALVLDRDSSVLAVELVARVDGSDLDRNERKEMEKALIEQYGRSINRGQNRVSRRGADRRMQIYVAFEISDKGIIEDIIKTFKLDEKFGITASERIDEYMRSHSRNEYMNEVFNKYFSGMTGVDVFEVERSEGCVECYFIFSPDVSMKEVKRMIKEYGITIVYDENAKTYIGSCKMVGVNEEVEEIRKRYF